MSQSFYNKIKLKSYVNNLSLELDKKYFFVNYTAVSKLLFWFKAWLVQQQQIELLFGSYILPNIKWVQVAVT
jgi:hypothetical protein